MTWITLELVHASAPHSRADAERPERHSHAERRNDQRDLKHADHAHACAQRYTRIRLDTDRAHAPRGYASRDAPRHTWHRLRIQLAERMTWITLELGRASAPHSRADAERPGRHSHAERRNDQRDLKHADHAHACAQRYTRIRLDTDRAHAPRGYASRDAPRHTDLVNRFRTLL